MKKDANHQEIRPIVERKNPVEETLKKDNSTEILAKAIKSLLNKDKKNG